jgi:Carboxypeptidase regulatory-like domain
MHRTLPRVPALLLLLASACIGPQGGHREGYVDQGPPTLTGPRERITTQVRGVVLDATTNVPIAGASVTIDGKSTVSGVDGAFTISDLLLQAATIETAKVGYDTARTLIPLAGGEYAFNPRLRPATPIAP